jgi:hypothetical protein
MLISCRYLLFGILTGAVYAYLAIVLLARKLMRRQFAQRSWRIARMVRRALGLFVSCLSAPWSHVANACCACYGRSVCSCGTRRRLLLLCVLGA